MPGAVAECGTATAVLWREAVGTLTYETSASPVTLDTRYDLASLTKVLATTLFAAQAVDRGLLSLDAPVEQSVPEWRAPDRHGVTIADLLSHASGLDAYAPLYRACRGTGAFVAAICRQPLAYPVRTGSRYSDLGFILLGTLLERVRDRGLDEQFADVAHGLGVSEAIGFRPDSRHGSPIAPTEYDAVWRGRLLAGEVHDENAWALGGVAGHAGLFGTAEAVGVFARHLLQILRGRSGLISQSTLQTFLARREEVPGSSRALGWDTMLPTSSCGRAMSHSAVGHTGFTGTSLWIDPVLDRYAVLLTNRVHPTREGERIQALRQAFHDAVWQEGAGKP